MCKKYTYEYIKESIENEDGYKLLSKEYKNNKSKLEVRCKENHIYKVTYNDFNSGYRCPICANSRAAYKLKHSYKYIKDQIEKEEGYTLLSKEYINNNTKLKIQCNKGHIYTTTWSIFQQGSRCSKCKGMKIANNHKYKYSYIKDQIEKEKGYTLLSKEYENCYTKLMLKCKENHIYKTTWNEFQSGHRCKKCSIIKRANLQKLTYKYVKEQIEKEGYKLLSKQYKNANTKLKIQCNKGHEYEVIWSSFQKGNRCPYCKIENKKGMGNGNWKGGVSKIVGFLRGHPLYKQWLISSLEAYNNKCIILNNSVNLNVHHLQKNFKDLILYVSKKYNFSIDSIYESVYTLHKYDKLDKFIKVFFKEHNKYLGVPLEKEVHEEFHKIYGYHNNIPEQFYKFYKIKTGKKFQEMYK